MRETAVPQIRIGSKAIGQGAARRAIRRALAALVARNERAQRERVKARAAAQKEVRVLEGALEKLIERDAAARATLGRLRRQRPDLGMRLGAMEALQPIEQPILALHLHQHVSVIGPPYDFGWNWGNHSHQLSNPATGGIGVVVQSAITDRAAAGIGIILTTGKPSIVSVRPYVHYEWSYRMKVLGIGSSASVRGGIDASAWVNGALIPPVRYHQAFEDSIDWVASRDESGNGIAPVDEVAMNFDMDPGKTYVVNFGAWVEADHSTGLGAAGASGRSQGVVQFIVVRRFVAG